jgi:hypothetical protein
MDVVLDHIMRVSSLSLEDYVLIVGHFNHLTSGSKSEIDPRLAAKGYSPEALAAAQKSSSRAFSPVTSQNVKFKRHLSHFKYPLMGYLLSLHECYENGTLPYPGSVADQPAVAMEAIGLISALKQEHESRQIKEQQAQERRSRVRR